MWGSQPASAQVFNQQGQLIGLPLYEAEQGASVALDGLGNIAIVGGPFTQPGAAWVFTRPTLTGAWSPLQMLVGSNAVPPTSQGLSVALSADGNIAVVGGPNDNTNQGAVWSYFWDSSTGMFDPVGIKGTVTDEIIGCNREAPYACSQFGSSVALSEDGSTLIVGGPYDNGSGAVWVFIPGPFGLFGGYMEQQKIPAPADASPAARFGFSVALSLDGNTALIGGYEDTEGTTGGSLGAAWVYTRNSQGQWSEQQKLIGPGALGAAEQGYSVALSPDGIVAIVGGPGDNANTGAAWVFTQSLTQNCGTLPPPCWSEQQKLAANNEVGPFASQFGWSVALSAAGATAIVGGPRDSTETGAAWVFTRTLHSNVWTQQHKLVGTPADTSPSTPLQGYSVAVDLLGDTVIEGGQGFNFDQGAAWVFFTCSALLAHTHDFNGDCKSDIVYRNSDGDLGIWLMNSTQILSGPVLGNVPTSWTIVGQRASNNSGYADLIWRNSDGNLSIWLMNGTQVISAPVIGNIPTSWSIVGTGAYSASNGYAELFWRNTNGDVAIWQINGSQILAGPDIGNVPSSWTIAGTGDFAGTGNTDILWRNANGDVAIWLMNGTQVVSAPDLGNVPTSWTIVGTGDFNGDGKTDILWRNSNGDVSIWLMNGTQVLSVPDLGNVPASWTIAETGDFNGDGYSDVLWRNADGDVAIWFMNGTQILSAPAFINVPTSWTIQGANAD
jgi:hypothetical protein